MSKVAQKRIPTHVQGGDPLRDLVLARVASAARPIDRGEIGADLSFLAGAQIPASHWRETVAAAIGTLSAAGHIVRRPGGFVATPAGTAAAARFLGVASGASLTWEKACNVWLIAKALGERRPTPKRLAVLAMLEGLRAAILVNSYGLTIRGAVTPARLRQALAAVALGKAFGGATAAAVAGKSGLPARASRLLAAQLLDKPRDPGTDRRLVSALAHQSCGARCPDLAALRTAVLRSFFADPPQASAAAVPADLRRRAGRMVPSLHVGEGQTRGEPRALKAGGAPTPNSSPQGGGEFGRARSEPDRSVPNVALAAPRPATPGVLQLPAAPSLDLVGFATEVRRLAAGEAQGWSGDRKAYISRVWRSVRERRPEWALSEIEFKCMLAEAHRSGQLNLANADLKDESNIKDVQDSAVIYRNAVFHFIRVDA